MARPVDTWDDIAEWWRGEVADDPVYQEDVAPMLDRLMTSASRPVVELGCGDGQWLRHMDPTMGPVFGCDRSADLLSGVAVDHPVAVCELPSMGWMSDRSVGALFSVFVLDLLEDIDTFFAEAGRVVDQGGVLVVIINHPAFTAPGSGPFMDPDFDVFWRWGDYLERGTSLVPAGSRLVKMHHRSASDLLTCAARAGWRLQELIEAPLGATAIEREPSYAGQEAIPRFLGVRWRR
jgi:SAM-dependent methyltransferase